MSNLVPGALFHGFGGGALHLQSQRKCQVRLNRARISAPNDSGGSWERLGGEEKKCKTCSKLPEPQKFCFKHQWCSKVTQVF